MTPIKYLLSLYNTQPRAKEPSNQALQISLTCVKRKHRMAWLLGYLTNAQQLLALAGAFDTQRTVANRHAQVNSMSRFLLEC